MMPKQQHLLRKLDEKIVKKESKEKLVQHKMETLRLLKGWIERRALSASLRHYPNCTRVTSVFYRR